MRSTKILAASVQSVERILEVFSISSVSITTAHLNFLNADSKALVSFTKFLNSSFITDGSELLGWSRNKFN